MLEELLKYDSVGSKDTLRFLLFKALPLSNGQDVPEVKRYCISNHFAIGASLDGALKLLEFMGFIGISDGKLSINSQNFNPAQIGNAEAYLEEGEFISGLLHSLGREDCLTEFIQAQGVKRDLETGLFSVKDSLIPLRFFGIRSLLMSLGFFEGDVLPAPGNLFIASDFAGLFDTLILAPLRAKKKRNNKPISLSQLKEQMNRREAAGTEAELFVLDSERERLQGHPSIDEIQRISDEYANAGYDLESFNDLDSVLIDRFIEVKSFSDDVVFYWSENEIAIARELAESYFLYLVDRRRMGQPGYAPRVFQNPYQMIFLNDLWEKEAGNWRISALGAD